MTSRFRPTLLPRRLFGRTALILIVPIVTIQLVVSISFVQRHFEGITAQMTRNLLLELHHFTRLVDEAPDLAAARAVIGDLAVPLEFEVTLPAEVPQAEGDPRLYYDLSGRIIISTLREGLDSVLRVDLSAVHRHVHLYLDTPHGPMLMEFARLRVSARNPHQLLWLMMFLGFVMTIVAVLFMGNQVRPIRQLAEVSEAFGKGRTLPYVPRGALEVRAAGRAFLDMRARIERQIEQRTLLLSGVSHDLRTPLTRLKLGLSLLDDNTETAALRRDVADMERLLNAFLAFARTDALDDPEPTDPVALVEALVHDARRAGQDVALAGVVRPGEAADGGEERGTELGVDGMSAPGTAAACGAGPDALPMLRPQLIRRAVENLINNATRYAGRAEVTVTLAPRSLRVTVEDDGPGIPPELREAALRPFVRLDAARNQNRGTGAGLGLTIALDSARSHGGSLKLGKSERLGGLRADFVVPL